MLRASGLLLVRKSLPLIDRTLRVWYVHRRHNPIAPKVSMVLA